jgi:tRNA nucleotidyltransferase (CCA-adding enzyme)
MIHKLNSSNLNSLKNLIDQNSLVPKIINKISDQGGKIFLVGGAVRDLLLNIPTKDLDIEVHGITSDNLEKILKSFGHVNLVGKIFGVFRIDNLDIDWSLPRTDTSGRKPDVKIDPFMSIKEAFRRRDLTINSMSIDLITFELVDPFEGYKDLQNKILRATDPKLFLEDPLRFYRVMQFIGRFEMLPNDELNVICASMDIQNVSVERIDQEFRKLFLKSKRPSLGIDWLRKINRLAEILPELNKTIGVLQELEWHPEGDVYEHSLQALDASETLQYDSDSEKLILMWSALCHDLGKVSTTFIKDNRIVSYEHEIESEILARKLLKRVTRDFGLIDSVCRLVRYHMQPGQFILQNSKPSAYKRLASKLAPYANLKMLSKLFYADRAGRNPKQGAPLTCKFKEVNEFINKITSLNISKKPEEPILHGRDLMDIVPPGPQMGELLKKAYEIQIDEEIKDKEELKKRILKESKK